MSVHLGGSFAALASGDGVECNTEPGFWSVQHTPAAATQATITQPAVAGARHICKAITATVAAAATAQGPINVVLRDGPSGSGTIKWSAKLSAPANGCANIAITGLSIVGSVNTPMTLEFAAAGAAATEQAVSLSGFDVTGG